MKYNRQKQIDKIIDYFKKAETMSSDFLLGIEIEHFIIEKDSFVAASYNGENGIEKILKTLYSNNKNWSPVYEKEKLIGLNGQDLSITLEPGGQFEISLAPQKTIKKIEKIYLSFLNEVIPVLNNKNKYLITLGYQPVTSIENISLLPKERYRYMYKYFSRKGKYAHNMMKGTASVHVSYDFSSENDFIKKYRTASFLAPVIYTCFDNSPFFEGEISKQNSIRAKIWENCDSDRCGVIENIFSDKFGYQEYASFLLETPSLLFKNNDIIKYTEKLPLKDLMDPEKMQKDELEYALTMVFPEVRVKNFIEIRMCDSIPYPLSLSYLVFWKELLYNKNKLDFLYNNIIQYSAEDIKKMRNKILNKGFKAKIEKKYLFDYFLDLIDLSSKGLSTDEQKYINKLKQFFIKYQNPKQKTFYNMNKKNNDKKEALKWCLLTGGENVFQ